MVKALPSTKPKVNGSNPKDKPSAAQLAYESEESRCFYCKSLLLITDSDSFHAVCSENCPSRLVQLDSKGVRIVKRAWKWRLQLSQQATMDPKDSSKSVSKECESVSVESTRG